MDTSASVMRTSRLANLLVMTATTLIGVIFVSISNSGATPPEEQQPRDVATIMFDNLGVPENERDADYWADQEPEPFYDDQPAFVQIKPLYGDGTGADE